jgi:hypothetical protein
MPFLNADLHSQIKNTLNSTAIPSTSAGSVMQPSLGTAASYLSSLMPVTNNAVALQQLQTMIQLQQQNLPAIVQQQNIPQPPPTKKKAGPGRPKGSGSASQAPCNLNCLL